MLKDKKVIVDMSLRNKSLYSLMVDDCQICVTYRVSTKTGSLSIYTNFGTPQRQQSKALYSRRGEGVCTSVYCRVNLKTGHIGIVSTFSKQYGWNGGSATNSKCTLFLGVVVAERVLSKVFDNVERMPPNNPGYDFICNKGFKIDVKSACLGKEYERWAFNIKRNKEADYFLCLAFDNRNDLNPQHIWLIPSKVVNHLKTTGISGSTLEKWSQYELIDKIDDVVACCDTLKDQS